MWLEVWIYQRGYPKGHHLITNIFQLGEPSRNLCFDVHEWETYELKIITPSSFLSLGYFRNSEWYTRRRQEGEEGKVTVRASTGKGLGRYCSGRQRDGAPG